MTYDKAKENSYVNMDLGLPRKYYDRLMHTIVKRRKLNNKGKAVGNINNNPLLDTRSYEVEFTGGTTEVINANIIIENLLARVDE